MPTPRRYADPAQRQAAYRRRLAEARQQQWKARQVPPPPPIPTMPGRRRWEAMTQHVAQLLQTVQHEMQTYYDLRSEAWQTSERGEAFLERLQALEEAVGAVDCLPAAD